MPDTTSKTGIVFTINDLSKSFDATGVSYVLSQAQFPDGRPQGQIIGGQIHVSIDSSDDTTIVEWMSAANKFYDGKVDFYQPDDPTKIMKTLNFTKGYCVSYSEGFSMGPAGSQNFIITCNKIDIGSGGGIDNQWPA